MAGCCYMTALDRNYPTADFAVRMGCCTSPAACRRGRGYTSSFAPWHRSRCQLSGRCRWRSVWSSFDGPCEGSQGDPPRRWPVGIHVIAVLARFLIFVAKELIDRAALATTMSAAMKCAELAARLWPGVTSQGGGGPAVRSPVRITL